MKKVLIGLALALAIASTACSKDVTVTTDPVKALELFTQGQHCTYENSGNSGISGDVDREFLMAMIPVVPIYEKYGIPLDVYTCS